MSEITFVGSAHPPGKSDGYDGFYFTETEIKEHSEKLAGIPIFEEHSEGHNIKIGQIKRAWKGEDGSLEVEGVISRDTLEGCSIIHKMRNGEKTGLSLGATNLVDPKKLRVVGKQIRELSVVKNPAMETYIKDVQKDPLDFELMSKQVAVASDVVKLNDKLYKLEMKEKARQEKRALKKQRLEDEARKRETKMSAEQSQQAQNQTPTPQENGGGASDSIRLLQEKLAQLESEKADALQKVHAFEEQKKNEEVERDQKRLKYIQENKSGATDFVAKLLNTLGKEVDSNLVMQSLLNADKNPAAGSSLIEIMTEASNQNQAAFKEKEKAYQQAKEYEKQVELLAKKNEYTREITTPGLQNKAPAPPVNKTQNNSDAKKRNHEEFTAHQTHESYERPDLSVTFGNTKLTLRPLPQGKGLQAHEPSSDLLRFISSHHGGKGMERVDYWPQNATKTPSGTTPMPGGRYAEIITDGNSGFTLKS